MDNLNSLNSKSLGIAKNDSVTSRNTSDTRSSGSVDKEMFMKILVAQMANQDPLNPQDPSQYVSQLAEFSSLEQMMNMNTNMDILLALSNANLINSALGMATSLIGKEVELANENSEGEGSVNENFVGEVQSTYVKDGIIYLDVKLNETGEVKSFKYEDLLKISNKNNSEDK
ncbi:flagellar biosynthesis protein FlgD [Clostridioides mangenotii]|uniref:flagellar hook assembly protein FlgD n=1 Tax=Metaclostridioides mangenotii TaxID=1540 RepID=UPI001C0FDCD1|nr:flagellar hook capping FlgD N-terminal domain-containing protein [Clostridioides mangenotii]MBU5307838.1 flagellar biosynthesis protein FlgD [Clostridioides mangenotii]